jgi:molybdopterin/thiamine biosynthesis adenylyltransferase
LTAAADWELPWWNRYGGRLEHEINELIAAGIKFEVDEKARSDGHIKITADVPRRITSTETLRVHATFPDLYPHFRPQITAPKLRLAHHFDPFGDDLCLVGRGSALWSERDTLAWLLTTQLPLVLREAGERDPAQAEPFSAYLTYLSSAAVLIETDRLPSSDADRGSMTLSAPGTAPDGRGQWLAAIAGFHWRDGSIDASPALTEVVGGTTMRGAWLRLTEPSDSDDPALLWKRAVSRLGAAENPPTTQVGNGRYLQFIALLFPEEQQFTATDDAVVVLVHDSDTRSRVERRRSGQRGKARPALDRVIRTSRAGAADLVARDPELARLRDKHVLLVGCGALGSVVADNLARAGVGTIALVDGDVLDAGNLVRHALDISAVGIAKSAGVARHVAAVHPGTNVIPYRATVGRTRKPGDEEFFKRFPLNAVREADLVIDATAEIAVHEVLAEMCRDLQKSCIIAEGTHGAWGGIVGVFPGCSDACWNCLELSIQSGNTQLPRANEGGRLQPPGCSEPTFTGAGFDMNEIALHAARRAVMEMLESSRDAVFETVELRDSQGRRIAPLWSSTGVIRIENCGWSH